MPHITVEHSFAITKHQIDDFLLSVNREISQNEGGFSISECKARAVLCNDFLIADGSDSQAFMHITVKIMSGRSLEIRQNLAKNLLKITEEFLQNIINRKTSLSIDIAEMSRDIYQKTTLNIN